MCFVIIKLGHTLAQEPLFKGLHSYNCGEAFLAQYYYILCLHALDPKVERKLRILNQYGNNSARIPTPGIMKFTKTLYNRSQCTESLR